MAGKMHLYGMRLRGYSIGCQPKEGLLSAEDGDRKYWSYLIYDRKLSDKEVADYDLDYIGEIREIEGNMPYDKHGCHATGLEVLIDGIWTAEYYDPQGEGRRFYGN